MKNKIKLFISIFIIVQFIFTIKSIAIDNNIMSYNYNINVIKEEGLTEVQKALQEIAYSYYTR